MISGLVLVIDAVAERLPPVLAGLESHRLRAVGIANPDEALGQAAHDEPAIVVVRDLPESWARGAYCRALRRLLPAHLAIILCMLDPGDDSAHRLLSPIVDATFPASLSADGIIDHVVEIATGHGTPGRVLNCLGLSLDIDRMRLEGFNASMRLSGQMLEMLKLFMQQPGHVFSREEILAAIRTQRGAHIRSVDVYVRRLRNAIRTAGMPDLIETVHAQGYRLAID